MKEKNESKNQNQIYARIRSAIREGKNRNYHKTIKILTSLADKAEEYPEILLYLGRSYHAIGNIPNAIRLLQFYIKLKPKCSAGHFFLGRSYFSNSQYREAIYHLKHSIELNPHFPFVHGLLGLTYLKLKRYDFAISHFRDAARLAPNDRRFLNGYYNAVLLFAIKLFYMGEFQNSVNFFLEVLERDPNHLTANLFLSMIFREMKKYEFALFHINKVIKYSPEDPKLRLTKAGILLASGNRRDAISELKLVSRYFNSDGNIPGEEYELNKLLANIFFKEGNYRKAILYGNKLLKSNYNQPMIHALVGEAYRNLGEYEKSKNHYLRALDSRRDVIEFRYGLLISLWQLNDYTNAYRELKKILTINPDDELARYYYALLVPRISENHRENIRLLQEQIRKLGPDIHLMFSLGEEYIQVGLADLAEGWFLKCLRIDSRNGEAYKYLIETYRILGRTESMIETYEKYLGIYSDDLSLRKEFIKVLLREKYFAKASDNILMALSYEPRNTKLKEALAFTYKNTKRYSEALIIYYELLKAMPDNIEYLINAAICMIKEGNIEKTVATLEKAVKYFKGDISLKKLLAYCYYRREDYERATSIYREILGNSANDWQAYQGLANIYKKMGNMDFFERFSKKAEEIRSNLVKNHSRK